MKFGPQNDYLGLTPEDAYLLLSAISLDAQDLVDGPSIHWPSADYVRWSRIINELKEHEKMVPPPLGKDKVWTGLVCWPRWLFDDGSTHNQLSTIVRAKNATEAVRFLDSAGQRVGPNHFKNYWGFTSNREQLCACTEPGVWVKIITGWVKG